MASIYPPHFPKEVEPDDPEFEVFETLKRLPDNYSVFYSKKFKGGKRTKEECEVDFIIFDGNKSLLIVEVKGGTIEYDGIGDCWLQNGNPLKTAPERQASANAHSLIEFLGSLISDINVGWCVCFPNCSLPNNIGAPSGLPKAIIVDEAGMLEVDKAFGLVEEYYNRQYKKSGCNSRTAKEVRDKLTRGVGFVQRIGVRIAKDRQQLIEVTEQQFSVLEDLTINPRMAIKGYAGSGKTLIAQEFAKRLESAGKSVLLLFFNRMVANKVRYGFDRESTIDCQTFHGFARNQIGEHEPDWWNSRADKNEEFWNLEVPLKLADVRIPDEAKYDAIIVDEGQDFKQNWFEILELYLKDRDQSNFVVLYDEKQDIFGHWDDLPWGSQVARKALTKNCRNTKQIVEFLKSVQDCDMKTFEKSPEGTKVVTRPVSNQSEEREKLVADVNDMIKNGVNPGQIVIMLNAPKKESAISDLQTIGKYKVEAVGRTFREKSDSIRYTNIRLFKGLESDVVCVLGSGIEKDINEALYVQGSRARTALHVYHREGQV